MKNLLKIGTRASALALAQSSQIAEKIRAQFPNVQVELVHIKTEGDRISQQGLSALQAGAQRNVPARGVFTKEIEEALLAGQVDCAVHSFKDMATAMPQGLGIAAVPQRADARDCWVSLNAQPFLQAPAGFSIGTSSLRRQIQLRAAKADWDLKNLRGNLDSRLRKVKNGEFGAIVVAMAGIERLLSESEKKNFSFQTIPPGVMVPAPAQGALALQARENDGQTRALLEFLEHAPTRAAVNCERALLAELGAGCSAPVGAHALILGDQVTLEAMAGTWDMARMRRKTVQGPVLQAEAMARQLAREFKEELGL